jgi:hypothetical protein
MSFREKKQRKEPLTVGELLNYTTLYSWGSEQLDKTLVRDGHEELYAVMLNFNLMVLYSECWHRPSFTSPKKCGCKNHDGIF